MNKFKQLLLAAFILIFASAFAQTKQYDASWESLQERPYPQWFKDAKLGIFIHWGLYSVPSFTTPEGYAEWHLRGLQTGSELLTEFDKNLYGEDFKYEDLAPKFKAELFDPAEWADLFKKSGAKYILLVSKHHDGYCLWPSEYAPNWNSVDVGPKRDLVGELAEATRDEGLEFGLYYSLPEWNGKLHKWYQDPHNEIAPYVEKHMIPQFKELVSTYKPTVLFTDGEWYNSAKDWHAEELISWYYNLVGDKAIVNNRWGSGSNIGFLTPEYSAGIKNTGRPWAECRGLGRSFGLNRNEKLDAYMTPEELIHFFVKAVANGGGITLNVGPKADGQIPLLQQERLLQLGSWIDVNNEAIYASTPWIRPGEDREVELSRVDSTIDFNWVRNTPGHPIKEDEFTAEWNGFIKPDASGKYTFESVADDGVKVWIDGKLIINKWKKKDSETADGDVMSNNEAEVLAGDIKLKAGKQYSVKVSYYEDKRNASIQLFWSSNKLEKQIVPFENLFVSEDESKNGLNATYKSMQQYMAYTTNNNSLYAIIFDWPGKEVVLNIDKPKAGTKITLLGYDKPLSWQFVSGKVIVDVSDVYYNDLPCLNAWTFKVEGYLE